MMLLTFSSSSNADSNTQNETALKTTSSFWVKSVTALVK
jgi:hypothetical protein